MRVLILTVALLGLTGCPLIPSFVAGYMGKKEEKVKKEGYTPGFIEMADCRNSVTPTKVGTTAECPHLYHQPDFKEVADILLVVCECDPDSVSDELLEAARTKGKKHD